MNYYWEWKPAVGSEEWQPCPAEWWDGATLTIPSVQKSNEGNYHCVISNCTGSDTSNPAKLEVSYFSTSLLVSGYKMESNLQETGINVFQMHGLATASN